MSLMIEAELWVHQGYLMGFSPLLYMFENIHNEILEGRGRILKHNSFGTTISFLGIYLTDIDVHMYIINN